jgi:hypothetical protein
LFIGWWRGTEDVPGPGDRVANFGNSSNFIENPEHSFTKQPEHVTFTALWGRGGIIGPFRDHNLVIENVPAYPVLTGVARPSGQTENEAFYHGDPITLAPGVRNADGLNFLGWYRGTTDVPVPGDNLRYFENSPHFVERPDHSFNITASVTYTALWGCGEGYVGGRFNLEINNIPVYPVPQGGERPYSQTESGVHSAGQVITLSTGNRTADNLYFLGWWQGANPPQAGEYVADFRNNEQFFETPAHQFTMPATSVTYTALWGREGRVGFPDVSIEVEVCDDTGEVDVRVVPPDTPYYIGEDDGDIVITFPTNPREDEIEVIIPDGWEYDIIPCPE